MSCFRPFPAMTLICILPFALVLPGCGGGEEAVVSRLPFQDEPTRARGMVASSVGVVNGLVDGGVVGAGDGGGVDESADDVFARNRYADLSFRDGGGDGGGVKESADDVPADDYRSAVGDWPVQTIKELADAAREGTDPDAAAQLAAVRGFELAMTTYREARAQPVQPNHPLLELTFTPPFAAKLKEGLTKLQQKNIALRFPNGRTFAGRYVTVTVHNEAGNGVSGRGVTASLMGCTHYRAIEFNSHNGSNLGEFDETVNFSARMVLGADDMWQLDIYTVTPVGVGGVDKC